MMLLPPSFRELHAYRVKVKHMNREKMLVSFGVYILPATLKNTSCAPCVYTCVSQRVFPMHLSKEYLHHHLQVSQVL
jgi:uncharacterized membrane protein YwaF